MKVFALIILVILISCENNSKPSGLYDSRDAASNRVWICMGTSSHAFHSSYTCKGMKACRGEKKQISLEDAYSMDRTPCHYCCDERIYRNPKDPDTYDPMNEEPEE